MDKDKVSPKEIIMSEHLCRECKTGKGDTCTLTGATHTTGIECPSFKQKENEMFKIGDKVKILSDKLGGSPVGTILSITEVDNTSTSFPYLLAGKWWMGEREVELAETPETPTEPQPSTRTFESGATRDTDQGKLDYLKALSPIVLRRYVQYLSKHREQPDGSYRNFDNWKKGIPEEVYISSNGRHFMDTWLLTDGYTTEDNHGPVELEDAICAQLFNLMGRLHELLKVKTTTTRPGGTFTCGQS